MNKIQRNAKAYLKLLDIEYIFYLAYKGNCKKIVLRFPKENFQHLEGIGQLKDLVFHQARGLDVFNKALCGEIMEEDLQKSIEYTISQFTFTAIKGRNKRPALFIINININRVYTMQSGSP